MNQATKKTILVTGSAGFIGFHTAKKLLEAGNIVIGADNFNDYYDPSLKKARNAILENFNNYKLYRGDLSDESLVEQIFIENKIDQVCHLAAQAGVRYSLENPQVYIKSNINAFLNILEAARNYKIKDLVYASSSSVYGNNQKVPFSISDSVDNPISLYAATKKADELMAHTYSHLFDINTTGLRFFTVIGSYGRPDMAPILFASAISKGEEIKVFNFGKMRRDFTYIDDIVDGILLALEKTNGYQIFNLGNNKPVELEYFISCIEKEIGKSVKKKYMELQPGDVLETFADISHTKKVLGWEPKTSTEEAIKAFIGWYKEYYGDK
jgi:UDP-glucuronate 4-epimerase